ncbi:General alpha-glucoside permease like protein [Verticillium longisporum]|nr:General alpha-glucoside permease like protein [Verticillium longisporum]
MAANPKAFAVMSHELDAEHTENAPVIEQVAEGETTLWTPIKENPRVNMFAVLGICGSFLFGYDIPVQGAITVLPMFFHYLRGLNAIEIMIGAASNGVVMDRFGRKIMFALSVNFGRTALVYVSSNVGGVDSRRGVLLAGKFVIGLGMDILMSTCQTYVSEISPPRLRTVLLGVYAFFIVKTTPHGEAATFADCSKGTDLRRTRIVAVLNTLQQLIGVSLIANSTYFFIMAGMSPTMSLTINQAGVGASVACTLISWFIIAKIGRRTAILALRFIGVALVMAACCSNLGTGTAYPIVAAEIPATRLRAKTLGSGFAVNAFMMWAFRFVVPYMFNADQGNLGGTIGPVFAGFCVVGFVVSSFEIPETKDITYSRINELFQTRTPAREFRAMAVSYEAEDIAGTGDAKPGLHSVSKAIYDDGVVIKSYTAWSLMDHLEWSAGYAPRFGITHVDFDTLVRTPKQSAFYLRETTERRRGEYRVGLSPQRLKVDGMPAHPADPRIPLLPLLPVNLPILHVLLLHHGAPPRAAGKRTPALAVRPANEAANGQHAGDEAERDGQRGHEGAAAGGAGVGLLGRGQRGQRRGGRGRRDGEREGGRWCGDEGRGLWGRDDELLFGGG